MEKFSTKKVLWPTSALIKSFAHKCTLHRAFIFMSWGTLYIYIYSYHIYIFVRYIYIYSLLIRLYSCPGGILYIYIYVVYIYIFIIHLIYILVLKAYLLYGSRTFHPFCGSPPDGSPLYTFFFHPHG